MSADSDLSELDSVRTCLNSQFDIDGLQESRIEEMCRLGSMCIYARVRPLLDQEKKEGHGECLGIVDDQTVQAIAPSDSAKSKVVHQNQFLENFTFTKAFGTNITQFTIFEETLKPTLQNFIEGQNSLVFSYGVTGSGKTFTLQGDAEHPGLIPLSLRLYFAAIEKQISEDIYVKPDKFSELVALTESREEEFFDMKENMLFSIQREEPVKDVEKPFQMFLCDEFFSENYYYKQRETSLPVEDLMAAEAAVRMKEMAYNSANSQGNVVYNIWISFYEIYNECIYDLLQPLKKRTKLTLGEERSGDVYVKGLIEIPVSTCDEALKLLETGRRNLSIASTKLNYQSSRSHCIFTIKVVKFHDLENPLTARVNRLSFCDLAGSERCAKTQTTGARLKEASNINTSLLVLGRCLDMMRTGQGQRNVLPFRDSKLTRLISSFFMGRGKAIMLTNASPSSFTFDETLHVLRFSAVAKQVMLNDTYLTSVSETIQSMSDKWARRFSIGDEECSEVEDSFQNTSFDDIQGILQLREEQLEAVVEHAKSLEMRVKKFEYEKIAFEFQIRKEVVAEMSKNADRYLENSKQFYLKSEAKLIKRHQDECEKIKNRYEEIIKKKDKKIEELEEMLDESIDEGSEVEEGDPPEVNMEQDEKIRKLEDIVASQEKKLNMERDEKIMKLEDIVAAQEKRLNDNNEWYETSVAERDEKIEKYASQVEDKNLQIQNCEVEIKAKDELIRQYEVDIEDQKADIKKHEEKIKQCEMEIKKMNEQILIYESDIKNQDMKIKAYEADIKNRQEQDSKDGEGIKDLNAQLEMYQADLKKLKEQEEKFEMEIKHKNELNKKYEAAIEDRDQQLVLKDKEIESYVIHIEDQKKEIRRLEDCLKIQDEKLETEIKFKKELNERYEADVKDRDQQLALKDKEIENYIVRVEERKENAETFDSHLRTQVEIFKVEIKNRDQQLVLKDVEIENCLVHIEDQKKETERLEDLLKIQDEKLEAEIKLKDELKEIYEADIKDRDQQLSLKDKKIENYIGHIEEGKEKVETSEDHLRTQVEKVEALDEKLEAEIKLKNELKEAYEAEIKNRDQQLVHKDKEIENYLIHINDQKKEIERLKDLLKTLDEKLGAEIKLKNELNEKHEIYIKDLDQQLILKDKDIESYIIHIEDQKKETERLEDLLKIQVEKLETEIKFKNELGEKYEADVKDRDQQLALKDKEIENYIVQESKDKVETCVHLRAQIEKLEAEIKLKNEVYKAEVKHHNQQLVLKDKDIESHVNHIEDKTKELERLKDLLKAVNEKLEAEIKLKNELNVSHEADIKDRDLQLELKDKEIESCLVHIEDQKKEIKTLEDSLRIQDEKLEAEIKFKEELSEKYETDIKDRDHQIEAKDKQLEINAVCIQNLTEKNQNLEDTLRTQVELLKNAKKQVAELNLQDKEFKALNDHFKIQDKKLNEAENKVLSFNLELLESKQTIQNLCTENNSLKDLVTALQNEQQSTLKMKRELENKPPEFEVKEIKCESSIQHVDEEKIVSKKKTKVQDIECESFIQPVDEEKIASKKKTKEDKENSPEYENEENINELDNAENNVGRRPLRQKQKKNYFDMIQDFDDDDDDDFQDSIRTKKNESHHTSKTSIKLKKSDPEYEPSSKLKKQDSTSSRTRKQVVEKSPLKKLTDFVGSNIRSAAQNVVSYLSPRAPPPVTTKRVRKIYNPDTAPEFERNSEDGLTKSMQLRRSNRRR